MTVVSSGNVVSVLLGPSCQLRGRVRGRGRGSKKLKGGKEREREEGRESWTWQGLGAESAAWDQWPSLTGLDIFLQGALPPMPQQDMRTHS